jgi:Ca2+-binding EF-hand superfamily protein
MLKAPLEATAKIAAQTADLSPEGQLADLQKQNAALKKELEKANDKLRVILAASEAASLVQPSDASLQRHFVDWHMFDGCLQALKQLDDTSLKEVFHQFADIQNKTENSAAEEASTDALDKSRLSKQGLAALFAAKNKTLSEGEVEELMMRIDTNGDGEIDWLEFRALARSNSDLEMFFKGLPLERVLASCFARGAADESLETFFSQKHSDVVARVLKAGHILEALIAEHIKKQNEATKARSSQEQAAGGAKYGAELKGATVEKFFEGVTGICGEPNPGVCVWSVCERVCV